MYCMEIFLSEDFCGCDLSQQLPWGTGKTEEFPDSSTDIKSGVGCCLERSKITFNCTKTCRTFLIIVLPLQGIGLDWWNAVKTRVYSLPWANNCHSHFQKSGANKYDFYPRFFFFNGLPKLCDLLWSEGLGRCISERAGLRWNGLALSSHQGLIVCESGQVVGITVPGARGLRVMRKSLQKCGLESRKIMRGNWLRQHLIWGTSVLNPFICGPYQDASTTLTLAVLLTPRRLSTLASTSLNFNDP